MNDSELSAAIDTLRHGGVIAYPTESVYGLGCNPFDQAAVERILAIKRRHQNKGLVLIASQFKQIEPLMAPIDEAVLNKVQASWPGPINWLLPASQHVPVWIKGEHDSVALRVTAHPLANRLCELLGQPLVSTSANRQGEPSMMSAQEVNEAFGDEVDAVIDAPLGGAARACTIIDALSGVIIRD